MNDFLRHHTQDLCTSKNGPLFLAHPVYKHVTERYVSPTCNKKCHLRDTSVEQCQSSECDRQRRACSRLMHCNADQLMYLTCISQQVISSVVNNRNRHTQSALSSLPLLSLKSRTVDYSAACWHQCTTAEMKKPAQRNDVTDSKLQQQARLNTAAHLLSNPSCMFSLASTCILPSCLPAYLVSLL